MVENVKFITEFPEPNQMLRLRCYVFANLVRGTAGREITREELQFMEAHRLECISCREREKETKCSLETIKSVDDIADEISDRSSTGSILDNLGFNIQNS